MVQTCPYLRLPLRAAAPSAGGITALSLRPVVRKSDEFMSIATGGCEAFGSHSSKVRPEARHLHPLGSASTRPQDLAGCCRSAWQVECFLVACSIPRIPKLEEPVVARVHEHVLLRGPIHVYMGF